MNSGPKEVVTKEELKQLLSLIKRKWEDDDPLTCEFVKEIKNLDQKRNRFDKVADRLESLVAKIIAESLKRLIKGD